MTRRLYRLGRWCSSHGWRVVALWLVALLAVTVADNRLPPPPAEAFVLEGTNSAQAQRLLNQAFPGTAAPAAPLVVYSEAGLADPASQQLVADIAQALRAIPDVNAVITPAQAPGLISPDGTTVMLNIVVDERTSGEGIGDQIQATAESVAGDRAEVALGGYLGTSISRVDTHRSEAIGLAAALVILLAMLRRGWPVMVPLLTALLAVGIGLAVVGLLERVTFVPAEATILGTMLGLGVGIDYALFLVTRHRALLLHGFEVPDSAGRTAGTAGAGMVFAGGTLIAAVSGLALTGISFLMWLGFAAAIIVGTAVLAALSLVPALFGILGMRVLPKHWRGAGRERFDHHLDHGVWARIADAVTGRPWPFAIGATGLLLLLAVPLLSMQFGQTDGTTLPADSPGYRSTVLIAEGFGPGGNGPLVVVGELYVPAAIPQDPTAGQGDPRTRDPRLVGFRADLQAAQGVASVSTTVVSTDGGVAVWVVTPTTGPADPATEELVHRLRDQVLPASVAGRDMAAYIGGVTPSIIDLNERVADRLLPFIIGVVALSFLLLLVAYRSLVIPAKAAAMNLLSISAAYGVVVAVFQWGWGASLIGLEGPVPIQSFVPMMMFAVLFGLSMDYEVFLLTSFNEHWQRTGDMPVAVRRGLADTGQVITSAAAIMVVIFASFILTGSAIAKMFGVGLATAVLVDATLVRCLLVPAVMVLAARWTWWLPSWLDRRIPQLHVEGDPAALHSIGEPAARPESEAVPPAPGVFALLTGALAAWLLAQQLSVPGSAAALAAACAAGAIAVGVPPAVPGAGGSRALRVVVLAVGLTVAAVADGVVAALVPPLQQQAWMVASAGVLAAGLLAAGTRLRRYAVPFVLGAVAAAAVLVIDWSASGYSLSTVLSCAALPAIAAALAALAADAVFSAVGGRRPPRADLPVEAAQEVPVS